MERCGAAPIAFNLEQSEMPDAEVDVDRNAASLEAVSRALSP